MKPAPSRVELGPGGAHPELVAGLPPAAPNGLVRSLRSFRFAGQGVLHVAATQPNFWIHTLATAGVLGAGVLLHVSSAELAVLALTCGLMLVLEAVNTAVEAAVDAIDAPPSLPAKHAKDAAAGAVLLGAATAVVVGGCIFLPHLLALGRP